MADTADRSLPDPRSRFRAPRSPFLVPAFSNIPCYARFMRAMVRFCLLK